MTARRVPATSLFVLAVSLSVLAAALVAGPGVVGANHGSSDADYTVEPMDDRSPGATDVKYGQIVVGQAGVDLETLESMEAVYEEGSWAGCGPGDADVFGIDRGNTHDGYEVDEDLEDNTQSFSAGEDVFRVEFYGEDDFGPSTHLNDGDAVVSVAKCIDNPDEPGWYQITGSTTGVTEDGERVTVSGSSHYFWVCDCEDEQEAREELGPPPSEDQETETPSTPAGDGDSGDTPSDDSGDGSDSGSEDDSGEETSTGDGSSTDDGTTEDAATGGSDDDSSGASTPTETMGAMGDAGSSGSSQAAGGDGDGGGAGSWDGYRVQTPTPGAGDGFGGGVALVAFLGAALLFYRRR